MATFFIAFFTIVLLLVCAFMTVIILMQRATANAGMGTALGGGAAESVFGGETANVLLKNTIVVAVLFFLISLGLYLAVLARSSHAGGAAGVLPVVSAAPAAASSGPLTATLPAPSAMPVAGSAPAEVVTTPVPAASANGVTTPNGTAPAETPPAPANAAPSAAAPAPPTP